MTYCVGIKLDQGVLFASDSRTNAGIDNFAKFCKMTVFERPDDRVIVLLSSGNLAGTQAVIGLLTQRSQDDDNAQLWPTRRRCSTRQCWFPMPCATPIAATANIWPRASTPFNASFILGGQIRGEAPRLFRIYSEGNFIEAGLETPFFQTGETKYGKPIIDRVITRSTSLVDAAKCVLVSFDSTMRSNLSVGMPIDLICYERDSLKIHMRRRFDEGDPYFSALSDQWSLGVRTVFRQLPNLQW